MYPQVEVRTFCEEHGIVVTAYASFGQGVLFQEEIVSTLAAARRCRESQVLLLWALDLNLLVIPKSINSVRIDEFAPATLLAMDPLSEADRNQLDALLIKDNGPGQAQKGPAGVKFCWDASKVL